VSDPIRLVHLADPHLDFSGPPGFVVGPNDPRYAGRAQREVDIELALKAMVAEIRQLQPAVDVVVIAGDLFDRAVPRPRAVDTAAGFVRRLISAKIEVVIVNGNHDTSPGRMIYGNALEYLRHVGARVVNGSEYEIVGSPRTMWEVNPRLVSRLLVHALPYQAVVEHSFTAVRPLSGVLNVMLAHGRAGGAQELAQRQNSVQRSAEISTDLLRRGWQYVALGEWHVHRFRPFAEVPAYYAGSLEALTYGDGTFFGKHKGESAGIGGALVVDLQLGAEAMPQTLQNKLRRPVYVLEAIDAQGMDSQTLLDALRKRLGQDLPSNALVRQDIVNLSSSAYNELDQDELRRLRERVARCDLQISYAAPEGADAATVGKSLEEQWDDYVSAEAHGFSAEETTAFGREGRKRLEQARSALTTTLDADGTPAGEPEAAPMPTAN
jgi:DNA repair exonuclease SbcCD nuclease subunit